MIKEIKKYNINEEERIKAITENGNSIYDSIYDKDSVHVIKDLLQYEKTSLNKKFNKFKKDFKKVYYYVEGVAAIIGVTAIIASPEIWAPIISGYAIFLGVSSIVFKSIYKTKKNENDKESYKTLKLMQEANKYEEKAPLRDKKQIEKVVEQDLSDNVLLSVKKEEWAQDTVKKRIKRK